MLLLNGVVVDVRYAATPGRAPLTAQEMRYFEELVAVRADEIVAKWIDFFVLHKPIRPESITRRLK